MGKQKYKTRCFFDITIGSEYIGKVIFELFNDKCPKASENFRKLCIGNCGLGLKTGKPLHYQGCSFHRVIKGFMIQGGDFSEGNGTGGESIFGGNFSDENLDILHSRPYLLSMANRGPNTNGSQFFITTAKAPHLDGKHVVFGHVISGEDVIQRVECTEVSQSTHKPTRPVKVAKCGELIPSKSKKSDIATGSSQSSTEDKSDDDDSRKKRKNKKNKKKKSRHLPQSLEEEEHRDDLVSCTIRPDEIPDVPLSKFLYRGSPKQKSHMKEIRYDQRYEDNHNNAAGPVSRSGRKIKGRGGVHYHTPSRSQSRSVTPPRWRQAVKKTTRMRDSDWKEWEAQRDRQFHHSHEVKQGHRKEKPEPEPLEKAHVSSRKRSKRDSYYDDDREELSAEWHAKPSREDYPTSDVEEVRRKYSPPPYQGRGKTSGHRVYEEDQDDVYVHKSSRKHRRDLPNEYYDDEVYVIDELPLVKSKRPKAMKKPHLDYDAMEEEILLVQKSPSRLSEQVTQYSRVEADLSANKVNSSTKLEFLKSSDVRPRDKKLTASPNAQRAFEVDSTGAGSSTSKQYVPASTLLKKKHVLELDDNYVINIHTDEHVKASTSDVFAKRKNSHKVVDRPSFSDEREEAHPTNKESVVSDRRDQRRSSPVASPTPAVPANRNGRQSKPQHTPPKRYQEEVVEKERHLPGGRDSSGSSEPSKRRDKSSSPMSRQRKSPPAHLVARWESRRERMMRRYSPDRSGGGDRGRSSYHRKDYDDKGRGAGRDYRTSPDVKRRRDDSDSSRDRRYRKRSNESPRQDVVVRSESESSLPEPASPGRAQRLLSRSPEDSKKKPKEHKPREKSNRSGVDGSGTEDSSSSSSASSTSMSQCKRPLRIDSELSEAERIDNTQYWLAKRYNNEKKQRLQDNKVAVLVSDIPVPVPVSAPKSDSMSISSGGSSPDVEKIRSKQIDSPLRDSSNQLPKAFAINTTDNDNGDNLETKDSSSKWDKDADKVEVDEVTGEKTWTVSRWGEGESVRQGPSILQALKTKPSTPPAAPVQSLDKPSNLPAAFSDSSAVKSSRNLSSPSNDKKRTKNRSSTSPSTNRKRRSSRTPTSRSRSRGSYTSSTRSSRHRSSYSDRSRSRSSGKSRSRSRTRSRSRSPRRMHSSRVGYYRSSRSRSRSRDYSRGYYRSSRSRSPSRAGRGYYRSRGRSFKGGSSSVTNRSSRRSRSPYSRSSRYYD